MLAHFIRLWQTKRNRICVNSRIPQPHRIATSMAHFELLIFVLIVCEAVLIAVRIIFRQEASQDQHIHLFVSLIQEKKNYFLMYKNGSDILRFYSITAIDLSAKVSWRLLWLLAHSWVVAIDLKTVCSIFDTSCTSFECVSVKRTMESQANASVKQLASHLRLFMFVKVFSSSSLFDMGCEQGKFTLILIPTTIQYTFATEYRDGSTIATLTFITICQLLSNVIHQTIHLASILYYHIVSNRNLFLLGNIHSKQVSFYQSFVVAFFSPQVCRCLPDYSSWIKHIPWSSNALCSRMSSKFIFRSGTKLLNTPLRRKALV